MNKNKKQNFQDNNYNQARSNSKLNNITQKNNQKQ